MRTLLLISLLALSAATSAAKTSEVWTKTDNTIEYYLEEHFIVIGFSVDSGNDFASGLTIRYLLQRPFSNRTQPVVMCTERGNKHECWTTKEVDLD